MGDVHKFRRPPKNQGQFKGYRPQPSNGSGGGKPGRRPLRPWQRSAIAWLLLVVLAIGLWAVG